MKPVDIIPIFSTFVVIFGLCIIYGLYIILISFMLNFGPLDWPFISTVFWIRFRRTSCPHSLNSLYCSVGTYMNPLVLHT